MSQDPFNNPYTGGMPSGPNPAAGKVAIPAILLMVAGGIGLLHGLFVIVSGLFAGQQPVEVPPEVQGDAQAMKMIEMIQNLQGPMAVVMGAVFILVSALIIFGAIKMKGLSSYGLAMTASVLAVIPCASGIGCCLGLPIGIWSIVVLMAPDVKAAFR